MKMIHKTVVMLLRDVTTRETCEMKYHFMTEREIKKHKIILTQLSSIRRATDYSTFLSFPLMVGGRLWSKQRLGRFHEFRNEFFGSRYPGWLIVVYTKHGKAAPSKFGNIFHTIVL